MDNKEDLTFGTDVRGDHALFIEQKHFDDKGYSIDDETKEVVGSRLVFFRVLYNGKQLRYHGWIENGEIVQWG